MSPTWRNEVVRRGAERRPVTRSSSRVTVAAALAVAFLTLTAASCPPKPVEQQAYEAINATAVTVDGAMTTAGVLYRSGKVTDAQKAQILAVYSRYQHVARIAVAAARTYQSRDDLDAALLQVRTVVAEIVALVDSFRRAP